MTQLAWKLWLPVSVLILWQALAWAGAADPLFFPPPSKMLASAAQMTLSGELPGHVRATLARMAAGFLAGAAPGLGIGLLMGVAPRVRQTLEPIISAIYSTPKLSLFPMLMLLLGVGEAARTVLIAAASFTITAMHALDAVRNLERVFVEMAVNYGARRMALFRSVYLPACLPYVFTGLRLALGRSLVVAVTVELVSSSNGLGSMIWMSWQTLTTDRLYLAVFLTAALGGLLHYGLRHLEKRLIPWKA
ncbi:MAG: ABC transporter permease [Acidobacteria bacterium]|nr:ABC transporter permease [Acidobacteriota bacterium]